MPFFFFVLPAKVESLYTAAKPKALQFRCKMRNWGRFRFARFLCNWGRFRFAHFFRRII